MAGDQFYTRARSTDGFGIGKTDPLVIGAVDGHDIASHSIDQIDGRKSLDRPMPDARQPAFETKLSLLIQVQPLSEGAREIEEAVGQASNASIPTGTGKASGAPLLRPKGK